MQARNRNIRQTMNLLEKTLTSIQQQAELQRKEQARVAELTAKALDQVRGTKDVTEQAREAAAQIAEEKTIAERIRATIEARGPMNTAKLAEHLGLTQAKTSREVRALRVAGHLRNVGEATDPTWWWAVGDEGSTPELKRSIEVLLRHHKPMTSAELEAATGARRNRINGVLVKLQVAGVPLKNLGDSQRAIWAIKR